MAAPEEARAQIQHLLVTGDNRLKQGVSLDKVRESYEAALEAARAAGSRTPFARSSSSGSRTSRSRSTKQKLLHPLRLPPDVVGFGRAPGREVGTRQQRRRIEPRAYGVVVGRIDEDAGFGRDELGRAADARRDDRSSRCQAFERREAERLGEARLADDVGCGDPGSDPSVVDGAGEVDPRPALERPAQRAVADERELSLASVLERAREPQHVLPLAERADAEESCSLRRPAHLRPGSDGVAGCELLEVDAAVDHRALRERIGHHLDEPVEQPGRHGDDRVRPAHGELRRRADGAAAARVLDVLPVGRDDERGATGERGKEARGDEEVRVDDVGTEECAVRSTSTASLA